MKTKLPEQIKNVEDAKKFLTDLVNNNEAYHPEDDATDLYWVIPEEQQPTHDEALQLNKLMDQVYALPECKMDKNLKMEFDPCGFILDLINAL